MKEYLFYVEYPISGSTYKGKIIKRVKSDSPERAADRVAVWALRKFPWLGKIVDVNMITDALLIEPGTFEEQGISIVFPFDEELDA